MLQAGAPLLARKGLVYESRYVNLFRFEHLSADYLKLNPNGVVPTLVHDGHVVINSACINEYIDEVFPDPRLSPADPNDRARMRLWTWTADDAHIQGARLTRNRRLKASVQGMSEADVALVLARMPVPARRERWQRQTVGGHSDAEMETAAEHMRFVAERMERELVRGPWLAGEIFLARRHRHGLAYSSHPGAGAGAVAAQDLAAPPRLVRPIDGAAGSGICLHGRHGRDAEACAAAKRGGHQRISHVTRGVAVASFLVDHSGVTPISFTTLPQVACW